MGELQRLFLPIVQPLAPFRSVGCCAVIGAVPYALFMVILFYKILLNLSMIKCRTFTTVLFQILLPVYSSAIVFYKSLTRLIYFAILGKGGESLCVNSRPSFSILKNTF